MGKYERDKGARGERELANLLKTYGYDCYRAQQYCGTNGDADVVGLPGIYIECKRTERLNVNVAMDQASNNATGTNMAPAVFHRKNGRGWLVTMHFEDWIKLYTDIEKVVQ